MADVVKNGRTKGGRTRFTSSNVQRMMDKAAPGGKQPKLTSQEVGRDLRTQKRALSQTPVAIQKIRDLLPPQDLATLFHKINNKFPKGHQLS